MPGEQEHRRIVAGLPLAVMAAVVLLDQVSKWIIVRTLGPDQHGHQREIIPAVLGFHYVENTGAAFGIFRGQMVLLTIMATLVVVGIIIIYRRVPDPGPWMMVSLGLLLGGALGNLIDRFRLGYVVDFVSVSVWPKFNVADSAITIGVVVIGWSILFGKGMWAGEPTDADEKSAPAESSGSAPEPRGLGSMSHDVRER